MRIKNFPVKLFIILFNDLIVAAIVGSTVCYVEKAIIVIGV